MGQDDDSDEKQVVSASLHQLIPVHFQNLALQGSLYLNRARIWIQIEKALEAIQDLTIAIALWSLSESEDDEARHEQMAKAHTLRAKIRLARTEVNEARQDV